MFEPYSSTNLVTWSTRILLGVHCCWKTQQFLSHQRHQARKVPLITFFLSNILQLSTNSHIVILEAPVHISTHPRSTPNIKHPRALKKCVGRRFNGTTAPWAHIIINKMAKLKKRTSKKRISASMQKKMHNLGTSFYAPNINLCLMKRVKIASFPKHVRCFHGIMLILSESPC